MLSDSQQFNVQFWIKGQGHSIFENGRRKKNSLIFFVGVIFLMLAILIQGIYQ
jgi:hypothetical protein